MLEAVPSPAPLVGGPLGERLCLPRPVSGVGLKRGPVGSIQCLLSSLLGIRRAESQETPVSGDTSVQREGWESGLG